MNQHTCIVQNVLYNILDLLQGQMVLRPLSFVAMHSHCQTIGEIALLEALDPDLVKKQESALAHTLTLMVQM